MRNKMFDALPLPDQIALLRAQIRRLEAQETVLKTQMQTASGTMVLDCDMVLLADREEPGSAPLPDDAIARLQAMAIGDLRA